MTIGKRSSDHSASRIKISLQGMVQGVGFRPFVSRLANRMGLKGRVSNSCSGVEIEAEGPKPLLDSFLLTIQQKKPGHCFITNMESSALDPVGYRSFVISESKDSGKKTALVMPDIALCGTCLKELFDPADRRYRYPFINCTYCGPRYSIVEALPYDRINTTMRGFKMCQMCRSEYENPLNRRYHAQPNACPVCGPRMVLWDSHGRELACDEEAVLESQRALRSGKIVALKGLGGFQLLVDAANSKAVARLRKRKHREQKPFAVMISNVAQARQIAKISRAESDLLKSTQAPIVLLERQAGAVISEQVAPGNPMLGLMLPYTGIHHLLMEELDYPVVATSGNLSEEPIVIDEQEALKRLGGIADLYLVHDRPIARHVDDSVVRMASGRPMLLRRARGYAPLPVRMRKKVPSVLSVGAHLKNTIAQSAGENIFISQHIGDLENVQALETFRKTIQSFQRLYKVRPTRIICDRHPRYLSTQAAYESGLPLIKLQHHQAHILSCMAENDIEGPVLGVVWDGTGFGPDGTVWGGEFLEVNGRHMRRVATFKRFKLLGNDQAVRQPRRVALSILYETFGDKIFSEKAFGPYLNAFSSQEQRVMRILLRKSAVFSWTTSAGRLFDAAASLLGIRQENHYEAQAAMELEFLAQRHKTDRRYAFTIEAAEDPNRLMIFNWEGIIRGMLADRKNKVSKEIISAKFHNSLCEVIVTISKRTDTKKIVLSGGCFQNKYLLERTVTRLRQEGLPVYWHQRVPPNDGGISLGQAAWAFFAGKNATSEKRG